MTIGGWVIFAIFAILVLCFGIGGAYLIENIPGKIISVVVAILLTISVVEWAQMVARKQVHSEQRYLVDELQMVLSQMNVEAATLNEDSKEEVHMFGVKETCCTRCSHRDVCQYKEEYLAAQHAMDEVSVHLPTKDENSARMIRLRDIPWIEPVELKCRHFQQNTGVAR